MHLAHNVAVAHGAINRFPRRIRDWTKTKVFRVFAQQTLTCGHSSPKGCLARASRADQTDPRNRGLCAHARWRLAELARHSGLPEVDEIRQNQQWYRSSERLSFLVLH